VAVFAERRLTARKGKTRVELTLRVHAPKAHGDHADCAVELRAGTRRIWPATRDVHIGGADSWQALVLALRLGAQSLVLFERDTGMRIDDEDWMDVVDLLGEMAIPTEMRGRIAAIERAIRKAERAFRARKPVRRRTKK
jgi:hypothetical protein